VSERGEHFEFITKKKKEKECSKFLKAVPAQAQALAAAIPKRNKTNL